jgi:signal transduction histidine kinase
VTLHRALQPLPKLRGRAGHLNQLFLNVLRNAVQAVGERGTVRVAAAPAAGVVRVEVSDDGGGIAEADLARVFDPFFTTRAVGEGTGLGLTVARDIVHAHGGTIELASRRGSGTRVVIALPVAQ